MTPKSQAGEKPDPFTMPGGDPWLKPGHWTGMANAAGAAATRPETVPEELTKGEVIHVCRMPGCSRPVLKGLDGGGEVCSAEHADQLKGFKVGFEMAARKNPLVAGGRKSFLTKSFAGSCDEGTCSDGSCARERGKASAAKAYQNIMDL